MLDHTVTEMSNRCLVKREVYDASTILCTHWWACEKKARASACVRSRATFVATTGLETTHNVSHEGHCQLLVIELVQHSNTLRFPGLNGSGAHTDALVLFRQTHRIGAHDWEHPRGTSTPHTLPRSDIASLKRYASLLQIRVARRVHLHTTWKRGKAAATLSCPLHQPPLFRRCDTSITARLWCRLHRCRKFIARWVFSLQLATSRPTFFSSTTFHLIYIYIYI